LDVMTYVPSSREESHMLNENVYTEKEEWS